MRASAKRLLATAVLLWTFGVTALSSVELAKQGDLLLSSGDGRGAIDAYDHAIRLDKGNYLYLFKRATAYMSLGKDKQALSDFGDILVLKPDFHQALKESARIHFKLGDFAASLEKAKQLGAEANELVQKIEMCQSESKLAHDSQATEDWEACVAHASEVLTHASNSAEMRMLRAGCSLKTEHFRQALVDLSVIAQIRPRDTEVYAQMARIHYWKYHEYESATKHIHRCTQFDPDSRACREASSVMRKWERRLKPFLSEARQKKASGHKIWQELEEGLVSQGALEELKRTAVEELIRAGAPATVSGNSIDLAEDLGDGLCEAYYNLKKYSLGLSWCEHALERNTDSIPAILLMAEVEIEAERYENAGRILSDAQRLHNPRINSRLREVRQMIYRSQHKDYYKILGVNQDASERDIKSAHRNKSREFHPDKYQGDLDPDKVMDKMAEINEAYEVLSDEEKRRQYDAAQVAGANHGHPAFGGGHQGQFAGFDFGAFQNQFQQHFMKQHRQ